MASVDNFAVSVKANSLTVWKEYFLETTPGTSDNSWTHVGLVYDPTFQSSEKILYKLETKIPTLLNQADKFKLSAPFSCTNINHGMIL